MYQLGVLLALISAPLSQPATPMVGKFVLLKQPGVAVVKDCKVQPPEVLDRPKDVLFQVVQVQGDWLWICTPRGMGWVERSDVLLPEEAVVIFSAHIVANAQNAEAWGRLGVALFGSGNAVALSNLTEANRLSPGDARWLHHRAQCYVFLKELDKAQADAAEAVRLDPENATYVALQGSIWHLLGNKEKTGACADAALRLDAGCADAYCLRAMLREDAGDLDHALADYDKAIELNPGHDEAYNNRALLYWKLHAYDRAMDDAMVCLRLGMAPAQAHRICGLVWFIKRDPDTALAEFDISLRLQPGDKSALIGRAGARQMKGDLPGALEDVENAVAGAPDDLTLLPLLVNAETQCRNWRRATATLQKWAARCPDDPRPLGWLADLYTTCPDGVVRDGKKAVECARRACDLTQWKNPFPLDTLAAAYAEAGDFASAVRWEKSALENDSFAARYGESARAKLQMYEAGQPYRGK